MPRGIRISDSEVLNEISFVSVKLTDILDEILNGNCFHWSILFLNASGDLGEGKSIIELRQRITEAPIGLLIKWEELIELSYRFHEIIDILVVADGCD